MQMPFLLNLQLMYKRDTQTPTLIGNIMVTLQYSVELIRGEVRVILTFKLLAMAYVLYICVHMHCAMPTIN